MRKAPTYTCAHCGDSFWRRLTGSGATPRYCGMACYQTARWGTSGACRHCGEPSTTRFCNKWCQREYWQARDKHRAPKRRKQVWAEKCAFVKRLGGQCVKCGNNDMRVLDVDHIDPKKKRKPRNTTIPVRLALWRREVNNLQLLCANCHRIKTHTQTWKTLPV
jgi:hypothetical protein